MITIVIIGRNDAAHVGRSIKAASLEAASVPGCSVLYADDCSDDGSFEFASFVASKLNNVKTIRSDRQRGIGGVRNFAIEYLTSGNDCPEYVWFNDSDDYVTEGSLGRIAEVIEKNNRPDCVSVPVYTLRDPKAKVPPCPVVATDISNAAQGPVGEWAQVFKTALYVKNPENQACEDCPWHYEQFDKFETWAKVEGDTPCYVWDNTNPLATTRTVDYCCNHSITLLSAALDNPLIRDGKNDRWVSDFLRNVANMYDVRLRIKKQAVRMAWEMRFRTEVSNLLNGFYVH